MGLIITLVIMVLISTSAIIYWHKKIDSDTTWIYGIYVGIMFTLISALLIFQQWM